MQKVLTLANMSLPIMLSMLFVALSFSFLISPVAKAAPFLPNSARQGGLQLITATKLATPTDRVNAGEMITYTIIFTPNNNRPLSIFDSVPEFTRYVPGTIKSGSRNVIASDADVNTMAWVATGLAPEIPVAVSFAVVVATPISDGVIITNTVDVGGITATISHRISSSPRFTIEKQGPSVETLYNPIIYTINYANLGTMTATDVIITDTLPTGMVYVSSDGTYQETDHEISWFVDSLPPNMSESRQLIVTTRLTGTLTNSVSIVSSELAMGAEASSSVQIVSKNEATPTSTPTFPNATPTSTPTLVNTTPTATDIPLINTPTLTPTVQTPPMLYLPLIVKAEPRPAIQLEAIANSSSASLNDEVRYSYRIVNIGNVPLIDITINNKFAPVSLITTTLGVNQFLEGTNSHKIGKEDLIKLVNVVEVTGKFSDTLVKDSKIITVTIPTAQLWIQNNKAGNLDITLTRNPEGWQYKCSIGNNQKAFCNNLHPGEYRVQTNTLCGPLNQVVKFAARDESRPFSITCN